MKIQAKGFTKKTILGKNVLRPATTRLPATQIQVQNTSRFPGYLSRCWVYIAMTIGGLLINMTIVSAQDPVLPPTNLGMSNVYDGVAGKPGWAYQGFVQVFNTKRITDGSGNKSASDLKINSIVSLNQLIFLTPVKILGGNLGLTILMPVVQISASGLTAPGPTVNPAVLGDIVQGTAIQWSNKKILGKPFSHRAELDITLPTGSYSTRYNINASSHAFSLGAYYAFTLFLSKDFSISVRNQFNYNQHVIGQQSKAGAYYNGNYSIDFSILPSLKIEMAAYYLSQINQDSYGGDSHYYYEKYGIENTRERVLGAGPGLAYFAPNGVLMEAKVFFETASRNRFEGNRPTLRIAVPLSK